MPADSTGTNSTTTVEDAMVELELPQDIVVDILSRLPVKSLLRFKCVRKSWHFLISSPQFTKAHLKKSMENGQRRVLLTSSSIISIDYEAYNDEDDDINDLRMEFDYPMGSTPIFESNIVGSCDGLVCLLIDNDRLILWNPSTRESKELARGRNLVGLYVFYGIGYDGSTDDYKVLRGVRGSAFDGSRVITVEVIALKNNTWRMVQIENPNIPLNASGTYINGALHWLVEKETNTNERYKIASFNLAEEKFEDLLQLPDHFSQDIIWSGLGISSNRLFVYGIRGENLFEAWMMEEYGVVSSWSKLLSFPLDDLPREEDGHSLLCFAKDGRLLISVGGWKLIIYDHKEDITKTLLVEDVPYDFDVATYVESLVSLNDDHGIHE